MYLFTTIEYMKVHKLIQIEYAFSCQYYPTWKCSRLLLQVYGSASLQWLCV